MVFLQNLDPDHGTSTAGVHDEFSALRAQEKKMAL